MKPVFIIEIKECDFIFANDPPKVCSKLLNNTCPATSLSSLRNALHPFRKKLKSYFFTKACKSQDLSYAL